MHLGRFVTDQLGILWHEEFQLLNAVSQSQDDTPLHLDRSRFGGISWTRYQWYFRSGGKLFSIYRGG